MPAVDPAKWGPYARLIDQRMSEVNASGYRVHWHWETPGEVLVEEWFGRTADPDKPAYVITIQLGSQPGTFHLKSSAMTGKEWTGTLQGDGSVSYVGKGLLKMPYSIRLDEQGIYEEVDGEGHRHRYASISSATNPSVAPTPAPAATPQARESTLAPAFLKKRLRL